MINLNEIISTFSKDEKLLFVNYLEKKNKRSDTKNIALFKLLAKNELGSKAVFLKLYNKTQKDAYHALRKRLHLSIIDFIANTSLEEENSIDMQLIKHILASRTFLARKQYKVAYKILDKAEVIASEHLLFPILNEIYHTKIQYAYANPSIEIDSVIEKFKINQKNYFLEDQLNIVYAKIRQIIAQDHHERNSLDFENLLENTFKDYNISLNDSMSFKSLYQLITIVSLSAFVSKDYYKIEPFLVKTYQKLKQYKSKEKQLYYHIQVLYLVANTFFRNKKFTESIEYLELMQAHMLKQNKKHNSAFKLKHNLLLALNLNYSNQQTEAITLLETLLLKKHKDIETVLDISLSLAMYYIQAQDYKKAHTLFKSFYHTDNYYETKTGKEWVIKKNLVEIILHIELENIDLVDSRLLSFKRNYSSYLKSINQKRVIIYLQFIEAYYKNPESIKTESFINKIEHAFVWVEAKREDIFVMSYFAWLKSKMENRSLYTVTLELVTKAQSVN
ncbi:hypothetical protein [Lacinutrix sp. Bg11-31]|uniref:hypothetical protein n=1 Tax=Lacinutrix sp. Bg11-31 TaxID=2057808 RepID=UPI000C30DA00|nr:hypothetical protein [Lacinutrix sp. Bg11-31]AUC83587.1 hypothetical protein CW733_16215 [Lacinutrix sp. Bg11-31]